MAPTEIAKQSPEEARSTASTLLLVADLGGVFVFAVEGALAARGGSFDLLGVSVLAFSTALGGGIVRDLLLGAVPPNAIRDQRYPITAFLGAAIVLLFLPFIRGLHPHVLTVLDAGGLALCAVAGAEKGLVFRVPPLLCVLLGAITGVGGGTIRDLLMGNSPNVLHSDVYATAAMAGAATLVIAQKFRVTPARAALLGGTVCFVLRLVAVWQGWSLPRVI